MPPSLHSVCDILWYEICLGQCSGHAPSWLLVHLLTGRARTEKMSPWVNATEQRVTHHCVVNIILTLNPKHSAVAATRKKINSAQLKAGHS